MENSTILKMKTQELIQKILSLGYTKYGIAKEIGVSWHCIHAYQRGWYEAGWDNFTKLQMLISRLTLNQQPELFDPVQVHNDEVMERFLRV